MAQKEYFESVNSQISFPQLEEKVLQFWKDNNIFQKSVQIRDKSPKWTFLDGPPFVTGMPHYGSLLSSLPKDLFPRFWTMKGYQVRRVWGWDGHGLPIENKVETKLGVKRKKDIEEKIGVGTFIAECLKFVDQVSDEWEWYVDHVGRWVDFKNAYKTWDMPYMESVMWVFKQMYEKGYIYKGLRVSLYCPHCSTPISNFEVAMDADNYKELTEPANTYKYKLTEGDNIYFLAWSTTPWNKIATPALAVNPHLDYVQVKQGNEHYILAKSRLVMLNAEPKYTIEQEIKGTELVGKSFVPHYNYYSIEPGKKAFIVIPGEFVTDEDGTGIVTIAAYGEDDLKAMNENDIQIVLHVDEEGHLKQDVPNWAGMYYLDVNEKVNEDLKNRGLMYREDPHTHTIPTCWRCHTRLYYAPLNAWYVDIQTLKPRLKENNEPVNWVPEHFKMGRFYNSVEAAPDWCISRNRYWGSPVPVWECDCGQRMVVGSIDELEKKSGKQITNLHKPEIDEVTIPCEKCGKEAPRVPEVLDSWIEAGSASFAERHFPFEPSAKLEEFFPPDFIVEYTGQIRAWFYVLHVISTALYDTHAFKNVLVTGVILGTDGRKMSKNFGNYPDPKEMIQKYGGDALRLYLLGSSVMHGEDIRISEEDYRNQVRGMLLILWNSYNYVVTYANKDKWQPRKDVATAENSLDRWIMSLLNRAIVEVTQALENYDTPKAITILGELVNEFSTWYIRRSRERKDKENFYAISWQVLTTLCKLLAPITPFVSEEIYKNLTKEESVHLVDWPKANESLIDTQLEEEMAHARKIVEMAHANRKESQIPLRQPLNSLASVSPLNFHNDLGQVVKDEVNVKDWTHTHGEQLLINLDKSITEELKKEGEAREIVRKIQDERKRIGTAMDDKVNVSLPSWPAEWEDYIKNKALVLNLSQGEFSVTKSE